VGRPPISDANGSTAPRAGVPIELESGATAYRVFDVERTDRLADPDLAEQLADLLREQSARHGIEVS
jgi:hypothetical protein